MSIFWKHLPMRSGLNGTSSPRKNGVEGDIIVLKPAAVVCNLSIMKKIFWKHIGPYLKCFMCIFF